MHPGPQIGTTPKPQTCAPRSIQPSTQHSILYSVLCLPCYNLNCRMMTKRAKIRAQPAKVTVVVS